MVVLPRDQVVNHDNWQVAGLNASGSCDYSIENVLVPEEMTFPLMNMVQGKPVIGGPALRLGVPASAHTFSHRNPLGHRASRPGRNNRTSDQEGARRAALFLCPPIRTFSSRLGRPSWSSPPLARSRYKSCRGYGLRLRGVDFRRRSCRRKPVPLLLTSRRRRSGSSRWHFKRRAAAVSSRLQPAPALLP